MAKPVKTAIEVLLEENDAIRKRLAKLETDIAMAMHRCEYLREKIMAMEHQRIEWDEDGEL